RSHSFVKFRGFLRFVSSPLAKAEILLRLLIIIGFLSTTTRHEAQVSGTPLDSSFLNQVRRQLQQAICPQPILYSSHH
ncbi:hypothetical protein BDN71DRAFT_1459217, partial [Pleurotus eryngii]